MERLLVDKEDGVEREKLKVHSVVVAALGVLLDADLVVVAVGWGVHRDIGNSMLRWIVCCDGHGTNGRCRGCH